MSTLLMQNTNGYRPAFALDVPKSDQFWCTGAVVDFSSVAPVGKHRPRCEHSSSEIATFGHDPGSDAETGPEEVREVLQTAPKSSYVRNEPAAKKK